MAISDEERRRRDRDRKRRNRAAKPPAEETAEVPRIGLAAADISRTPTADTADAADTSADDDSAGTNAAAARAFIAEMDVPARAKPLVPVLYQLAKDLDGPFNVPQRASITAKYLEVMDRILDAAKPVEVDELDEQRRAYYRGEVPSDGTEDEEQEAG